MSLVIFPICYFIVIFTMKHCLSCSTVAFRQLVCSMSLAMLSTVIPLLVSIQHSISWGARSMSLVIVSTVAFPICHFIVIFTMKQ
jgi:hypothetical protein